MFSFKEKSKGDAAVGITFSDDGIALAIIKHGSLSLNLDVCQFIPCQPNDQAAHLYELVKQYQLNTLPCNCVLHPGEYELIQIDAPEVPSQELSTALRWQIKDLIDFHIDDAVIDHIALPNEGASGKAQLLVIASKESVIRKYVDQLQSTGCNIATVDIAVQATRNIICKQLENSSQDSIGLLNLWGETSKISVVYNQDVYINRASDIGLKSLEFVNDEDINSQLILDSLALELQRTFDYYESHSRQAPISQIVIASNEKPIDKLPEMLEQRLGIDCINLDISDIFTFNEKTVNIDHRCISAIGGALRDFS